MVTINLILLTITFIIFCAIWKASDFINILFKIIFGAMAIGAAALAITYGGIEIGEAGRKFVASIAQLKPYLWTSTILLWIFAFWWSNSSGHDSIIKIWLWIIAFFTTINLILQYV